MADPLAPEWPYPGARWWKVDLHTHTPASKDTSAWQKAIGTSDEVTPEKWLLRCMEAGLDCVAVTDHNTGEWIERLKAAYADLEARRPEGFRPLYLFPGIELSVNGGFHLLTIFDLDTGCSDIDALRGVVEYDGTPGFCDGVTRKSPVEVIDKVLAAGGLPIPAHVDGPQGLLAPSSDGSKGLALNPGAVQQVLDRDEILAMEVVDWEFKKPHVYTTSGRSWTEVLGSDCHSFRNGSLGSRFTWVKMERPSLEGLRLALLDGERFSVRRSDAPEPFDPYELPEHFVEAIRIEEARFMGRGSPAELRFSPWLNAIVGGRGTGKSTVVHFLRLGFQRSSDLEVLSEESEPRRAFERFEHVAGSRDEHGGLCRETKTLLTVRRDGVRHRLRWRQDRMGPVVDDELESGWWPSTSQSVTPERFPVRLFSQGQIATLAGESQEALLGVIDEAARAGPQKEALAEATRRFFTLRAKVREQDGKLQARDKLVVELEDVERKLRRFEDAHHADVLKEYRVRRRQEREIQRQLEATEGLAERIETLAGEVAPEDLPGGLFDPERDDDREAQTAVDRLHGAIRETGRALEEIAGRLRTAAKDERTTAEASAWHSAVDAAKRAYEELTAGLREQGVADPSEYGKLVQDRQRLEHEAARLESLREERDRLVAEADEELRRVLGFRRELSTRRADFLEETLQENPYVRIELVPYGREWRPVERSLREAVGVPDDRFSDDICSVEDDVPVSGLVADLIAAEGRRSGESAVSPGDTEGAGEEPEDPVEAQLTIMKERFEAACRGQGDFRGHFNNYLERECTKRPELLDRLLTWFPEDSLRVQYSRRGDGRDFRPILQASAGERAAAMLAFLLTHGNEPLVFDQPEDDLDNHLIYDLVVRQIRDSKLRRQIIVVTHNPNIVVNGDAEMVHAMRFKAGQCRVVKAGSLQETSMRDEVCEIMEGGREAFERRFWRLGREI